MNRKQWHAMKIWPQNSTNCNWFNLLYHLGRELIMIECFYDLSSDLGSSIIFMLGKPKHTQTIRTMSQLLLLQRL